MSGTESHLAEENTTLSWYFSTVKCFFRGVLICHFSYCTFSTTIGLFGFALLTSCLIISFLTLSTVSGDREWASSFFPSSFLIQSMVVMHLSSFYLSPSSGGNIFACASGPVKAVYN